MDNPRKGRIFISYRRADSAGYAGRIYDRLTAHFGEDAVFMDVDTIEAGVDFVEVLQNAVQSCDVLVALIGRRWLDIKDETGKRRLDNPEDFVRVEIAAALSRDIRVIPVLVDGAPMPRSTELPNNLMALARRNALQVDHHSFNLDVQRLISQLELALEAAERAKAEKVRREREAREKKAAEDKRAQEAAAKAALEKEEREQKEREEREQKEREDREKAVAEENTRRAALRKQRQQEFLDRIKNIFRGGRKLPYFIGGGIVILFLLGYIIKSALAPSTPAPSTKITATLALLSATSTVTPTRSSFTPTPTSIDLTTERPLTPTPTLGVGSTMISEKDGMVMVYVPAGEFEMGSEDGSDWEQPAHTVYLDAFWIDQTEVTNSMYSRCVDDRVCEPPKYNSSYTRDSYYGNSEFDNYPVVYVSWNNAVTYCNWVGRRLPSEAEWEKAASWDEENQTKNVYPWGDSIDCSKANYLGKDGNCVGDTTAVGSYESGKSFYGTYDMAGNVWEWVSSLYKAYPYSATDGREDLSGSGSKVQRGGSWHIDADFSRSYMRATNNSTNSYLSIGFRCARDAE